MNVVDSCAWLAYLADEPTADYFETAITDIEHLLVPSVCILEVFKVVVRQRGEHAALQAVALMRQGKVVPLNESLAMLSAQLGLAHKLPLADSIVLATANQVDGLVWTQDADFEGLPGVRFTPKQTS